MKKILLFILGVMLLCSAQAQLQDRIWIFGRPTSGTTNATMYFGNLSNPIVSLPCGQPDQITTNNGWEEWGIVTNPVTGNLIFYTDGQNVFDDQHTRIDLDTISPGYESLGGNFSSSQPVALCPVPESYGQAGYMRYLIFSNPTGALGTNVGVGPITYRVYDVATKSFSPQLSLPGPYSSTSVSEGMKIVPCDNDPNTLWLITSLFPNAGYETKYVVYKIYKAIVSYQGVVDMGPAKIVIPGSYGASPTINIVYTKANTAFGITNVGVSMQYSSCVFVCQFDNINGQFLTNTLKTYNSSFGYMPTIYDLEFSPNGRFLYFTVYNNVNANDLYQIDLQDAILTPVLIHTYSARYTGGLALGPDSLIYHSYDSGYDTHVLKVGRVMQPDIEYIPGTTDYNLFYQNFQTYNNTMSINFCEFLIMPTVSVGFADSDKALNSISVFPNPASDMIIIETPASVKDAMVSVFNIEGQMMLKQEIKQVKSEINVSSLAKGVYVLKAGNSDGMVVKKLVVQK